MLFALAESSNIGHVDMQQADWDANPAEMIIGHTYHNKVNSGRLCMYMGCTMCDDCRGGLLLTSV